MIVLKGSCIAVHTFEGSVHWPLMLFLTYADSLFFQRDDIYSFFSNQFSLVVLRNELSPPIFSQATKESLQDMYNRSVSYAIRVLNSLQRCVDGLFKV